MMPIQSKRKTCLSPCEFLAIFCVIGATGADAAHCNAGMLWMSIGFVGAASSLLLLFFGKRLQD